ncbi:MAG: sigma-70 family RNA polymerase sigma factor [Sedimentibacter sp.]|uniref:sigma-70 family RNA polymerase sigma factor n=1 Tax=Sedimentibacter sp. TaxID=1960295 RepID=UPI002982AADD|nr:sigma-70 family RNA polymerase sigma factor [Sedimentibacter sp.]MDW5300458.1 sigma-70 family RNA polymerase sigma factor [Sedimentibacter sp.]
MVSPFFIINSLCYNREKYDAFSDEELIEKIRNSDDNAEKCLYTRYAFVVKKIISSFFIVGGEMDDLFQEAMIGFIKAIRNYNAEFGCSFRTFVELCIRRQIFSAIRKSKAYDEISCDISFCNYCDLECNCSEIYKFGEMDKLNPEYVYINEQERNICSEITYENLSDFEKIVLNQYCKSKSYKEISLMLNKNIKSIDNALQRVKKKMQS